MIANNPSQGHLAKLIDGKKFAEGLRLRIGVEVNHLKNQYGYTPSLAVVLVGDDPASHVYVRNKAQQTREVGMVSLEHRLAATVSESELLALIQNLNDDPKINGILVQLPLPTQINANRVIASIDAAKDVDGFHQINVGKLSTGDPTALVPCTPYGCLLLLRDVLGESGLKGANAVVVGRSNIVGKPMAQLLLAANATVTVAHSQSRDLPTLCHEADIIVAAVGRPEMVKGSWLKPGSIVIDVGINRVVNPDPASKSGFRLVGDVAFAEACGHVGAITPVPGGVGPMTIACLLANTMLATCRQHGWAEPNFG